MLFKLSLKNLKKSIKDYAIYFFTLILGVSIFYIFNSMETQTVFLNVTSSTREIIQMMITMLSGVSVFVSFILGFLIIYANQFLMKRRKKEFAIYMTLGMSKQKISQNLKACRHAGHHDGGTSDLLQVSKIERQSRLEQDDDERHLS